MKLLVFSAVFLLFANAEVFFHEKFDDGWEKRWVQAKRDGLGVFADSGDGIKTSQDAKFYAFSSALAKPASNENKPFVVQFSVNFAQGIDCGGGYIKLLGSGVNLEDFDGNSKYNIMFGPDICGQTKKIHLIFNYKGKNLDWKKSPECETDTKPHIYTAIINADGTYEVLVDGNRKEHGKLQEDWDFLPPRTIDDPKSTKPADWVELREIVDPNDKKPDDWEKPKTIPDPNSKKPDDWNDEEDGVWEPSTMPNPEYRGEYSPKMIPNPDYKGEWKPDQIPNPDYKEDKTVGHYKDFSAVGIDVWQVKSGTIFDDILLTSSVSEAAKEREELKKKQEKQEEKEPEKKEEKKDEL